VQQRHLLFLDGHIWSVKQSQSLLEVRSQLCLGWISEPCDVPSEVSADPIYKLSSIEEDSEDRLLGSGVLRQKKFPPPRRRAGPQESRIDD
jgi:hypothetical protein